LNTRENETTLGRKVLFDPDHWYKIGRGRNFSMGVSRDELINAVLTSLPEEYAPYSLVATSSDFLVAERHLIGTNDYVDVPINEIRDRLGKSLFTCHIKSSTLTPDLTWESRRVRENIQVNGLISIQDGVSLDVLLLTSSVYFVHKIFNNNSFEEYEHREYGMVFRRIVKSLKKLAKYHVIHTIRETGKEEVYCSASDEFLPIFEKSKRLSDAKLVPIDRKTTS